MFRPTPLRPSLHPAIFTVLLLAMLPRLAAAQSGPPVTPEIVAAAAAAKTPVAPGPVQPTWDSIRANYSVPQWFIDAKFGITMHWGLFSVPAYHNEWYEKYMYSAASSAGVDHSFAGWHAQNFGPPDKFGYKDFIPLFTAKDFNADDVAEWSRNPAQSTSRPPSNIMTASRCGTARPIPSTPSTWARTAIWSARWPSPRARSA